jgi:hypothetical protein
MIATPVTAHISAIFNNCSPSAAVSGRNGTSIGISGDFSTCPANSLADAFEDLDDPDPALFERVLFPVLFPARARSDRNGKPTQACTTEIRFGSTTHSACSMSSAFRFAICDRSVTLALRCLLTYEIRTRLRGNGSLLSLSSLSASCKLLQTRAPRRFNSRRLHQLQVTLLLRAPVPLYPLY